MPQLTVPITETAHRKLRELADRAGVPVEDVLDRAIEDYRRQQFLEAAAHDFAHLRSDPAAWREELEERAVTDGSVADDLTDDPYPQTPPLIPVMP